TTGSCFICLYIYIFNPVFLKTSKKSKISPLEPHFTECISREQETFRCWWSAGSFQNLSSPGALRVFYLKKESPTSEWKECPEYIYSKRECFFDTNHTSIWITYCIQLRTQNNVTYFNEDDCFTVENIVRPDPPVALNWTLMNMSPSGLYYDVRVRWKPPPSADVTAGWMRVEYEVQFRGRNSTVWEAVMQGTTQQTIYGLRIGEEYEVRIRCRMMAFTKFGEFSDSVFIHVTEIPSKEITFPVTLALIFGIAGILILIVLIVISQHHRLMVILLPPIPAPKIKGIDPELLKKGKLDELNFILSGGGMGSLPSYAPDFYQDEPWVEFIEVDNITCLNVMLLDGSGNMAFILFYSVSFFFLSPSLILLSVSFPDDDSGRASCYDPDLPDQDALMLSAALLPGQPEEASLDVLERSPGPEIGERPIVHAQPQGPQTWVNTDFYAQVSDVMPSGGVVLSPEEEMQKKGLENGDGEETEAKKEGKQKELQFQLLVVDPEGSGYTMESVARQISTPSNTKPNQEAFLPPPTTTGEFQSPYIHPDSPQSQFLAPVSDYTVVQEVDCQHSLLLNPSPAPSPPPCLPQHPLKALPAMPVGYISPELLGNLSP
uniref:Growth hormone receptor a n=1 Tax=Myripristis murdjan TaxID=586833 RepID=A0A667ZEJ6_9TELE